MKNFWERAGVVLLAGLYGCSGAPLGEFEGRLDAGLSPAASPPALQQANLLPMAAEKRVAWGIPAGMTDQVFETVLQLSPDQSLAFILVEPRGAQPAAFVDTNSNRSVEESEQLELAPTAVSGFTMEAILRLPLTGAVFDSFPIRILYLKHSIERDGQVFSARAVSWNTYAGLSGTASINGVTHRFTVEGFLPGRLQVSPDQAIVGIDTDADGRIDFSPLSPEWAIARNESVVLRSGQQHVSIKAIDPGARKAVLQLHPESDYRRIELTHGAQIPAFSFLDFEGARRNLTEFRGKYLLLDFWGSWCGPCIAEFPNLVETHAEFRTRGFEILGMNADPSPQELRRGASNRDLEAGLEKARQTVERFQAGWPQAQTGSIRELVLDRLRIYAYPTSILLDPEGRIVSTDDPDRPLRGPGLRRTLQALLQP